MNYLGLLLVLALAILLQVLLSGYALWYLVLVPIFTSADVHAEFRYWNELIYFISNPVLVCVAAAALIFAARQVKVADKHRAAFVFLEVEARWSSPLVFSSRESILKLMEKVGKNIPQSMLNDYGNDIARFKYECPAKYLSLVRPHYDNELGCMSKTNTKNYLEIMGLIYFLENMGLSVKRGYLEFNDIFDLIAPAIATADEVFRLHLLRRRRAEAPPKQRKALGTFKYTLWLMSMVRHRTKGAE